MATQPQKKFNILLVGDQCIDVYRYGVVDRISPEAPVPVFVPVREEQHQGMAANVCANLETLDCIVTALCGSAGRKTRLIDERSRQQLVRIDEDVVSKPVEFVNSIPLAYDAIVISDYNKGSVSYEMIEDLRQRYPGPIFVDTKKTDLARFEGCFVKINQQEHTRATSFPTDLIVTQGRQGAVYNNKWYSAPPIEVTDVTGAGDTFLAALAWQYLNTSSIELAIGYAVQASAVTVQHTGVYAPTHKEIQCV